MAQTISSKGWVVIPADLRKKYGLKPGDAVHVIDYGGVLTLVPVLRDSVRKAEGCSEEPAPYSKTCEKSGGATVEAEERKLRAFAGDDVQ